MFTGDVANAGTNSNVFICVYGELGDSGERKLDKSETHMDKFERNNVRVPFPHCVYSFSFKWPRPEGYANSFCRKRSSTTQRDEVIPCLCRGLLPCVRAVTKCFPREMCRGSLSKGKSRERTLRSDSISKISVNLREGTILECYVNIEYLAVWLSTDF